MSDRIDLGRAQVGKSRESQRGARTRRLDPPFKTLPVHMILSSRARGCPRGSLPGPRAVLRSGPSSLVPDTHFPQTQHPAPKPARDLAEQIELRWFVFIVLDGQGQHLQCPAKSRVYSPLEVAPWVITAVTPQAGTRSDSPGPRASSRLRHRHRHTPGNSRTSGPGRATRPGTGKGGGGPGGGACTVGRGLWPRLGGSRAADVRGGMG